MIFPLKASFSAGVSHCHVYLSTGGYANWGAVVYATLCEASVSIVRCGQEYAGVLHDVSPSEFEPSNI
jgi:hypothetical protein